jgi:uncharacterized protein (DUF1778 family)
MKTRLTKRGSPQGSTGKAKDELMQVRLDAREKQTFADAAALDGKDLSEWVRDRLRRIARQELEEANRPVPFLERRD